MLVDTDVIIRFLTRDDKVKADRFERFLNEGYEIILTDVTFAEVYWTLCSFYKFSKDTMLAVLESLANKDSILCSREILLSTIKILHNQNVSFIDAYTAARAMDAGDKRILSYDKDFDKIAGVERVEP